MDDLILNSYGCTRLQFINPVPPEAMRTGTWKKKILRYLPAHNVPECVGKGTIMDNLILNSYGSARLQLIQSTTTRGNDNWNVEEKILLYVPALNVPEGVGN